MNLRYFLTIGTLLSGVSVYLLGMAKVYNIHTLWYFMAVQVSKNCVIYLRFLITRVECAARYFIASAQSADLRDSVR